MFGIGGNGEDEVGVMQRARDIGAEHIGEILEVIAADGEFYPAGPTGTVDREARAVGAATGHHFEHLTEHLAEPWFKGPVLQEQANNSAHETSLRDSVRGQL